MIPIIKPKDQLSFTPVSHKSKKTSTALSTSNKKSNKDSKRYSNASLIISQLWAILKESTLLLDIY